MKKNKEITLIVLSVVMLILIIAGTSYAFISTSTGEGDVNTKTGKLNVVYTVPDNITGELIPSSDKDDGLKPVATAKLGDNSVDAKFNLYIKPTVITGLSTSAFKWEVYGVMNGVTVYSNTGTFEGATADTPLKIVDGYKLSTSVTTFNIYIWVDGSEMTDSMSGKSFTAKIIADSTPITSGF